MGSTNICPCNKIKAMTEGKKQEFKIMKQKMNYFVSKEKNFVSVGSRPWMLYFSLKNAALRHSYVIMRRKKQTEKKQKKPAVPELIFMEVLLTYFIEWIVQPLRELIFASHSDQYIVNTWSVNKYWLNSML